MIMEKYGWDRCNSEVLISTPRRFGKTFSCAHTHTHTHTFHSCMPSLTRVSTSGGSIAIFCACLALAVGLEIGAPQSVPPSRPLAHGFSLCAVVFSPARRASRKLLERIVEFVILAGGKDKIVEYNQEACRLHSFDGRKSLIRSFPSKVGVLPCTHSNTRTRACLEG